MIQAWTLMAKSHYSELLREAERERTAREAMKPRPHSA